MLELIAGGDDARSRAREALEHGLAVWKREGVDGLAAEKLGAPAAKIRLEAPIPRPPRNVFCLGRNYMEHAAERGAEAPAHPVYFRKAPECVLAPGGKIVHHPVTQELDYEVELAGRPETVETVHRAGGARAALHRPPRPPPAHAPRPRPPRRAARGPASGCPCRSVRAEVVAGRDRARAPTTDSAVARSAKTPARGRPGGERRPR